MAARVRARLGSPVDRQHFERALFRGVEVGLQGWERAHSQGAGFGTESAAGILYAPREVNQEYQNRGIEQFIRDLYGQKAADVDLYVVTETEAWPGTRRLKSIHYEVQAVRPGRSRTILDGAVEVENVRVRPRVSITASPRSDPEEFLRPLPRR